MAAACFDGSCGYVSYSLNSLKGVNIGDYIGDYYRGYYLRGIPGV